MQNNIPVPTDNIFKFYALMGMLLVVFTIGALLYQNEANNAFFVKAYLDLEVLKEIETRSQLDELKIAFLQKQIEVRSSDKIFINALLGLPLFFGVCGMGYGFKKWHTETQPLLDQTAAVQLAIARLELQKLQEELANLPTNVSVGRNLQVVVGKKD